MGRGGAGGRTGLRPASARQVEPRVRPQAQVV